MDGVNGSSIQQAVSVVWSYTVHTYIYINYIIYVKQNDLVGATVLSGGFVHWSDCLRPAGYRDSRRVVQSIDGVFPLAVL